MFGLSQMIPILGLRAVCSPYDSQLRFRRTDFDKIPANAFGVYGLWYRRRCIYVGKAEKQSIAKRLEQHWKGAKNPKLAAWVQAKGPELRVAYVATEEQSKISFLEKLYIRRFQPLANELRYNTHN